MTRIDYMTFNTHLDSVFIPAFWCLHFPLFIYLLRIVFSCGMLSVSGSRALFTGPTNIFFQQIFLLKIDLTALFTHLKIILLQYFQFSAK